MKSFFKIQILTLVLISFNLFAGENGKFPTGPQLTETPGSLCINSSTRRYPEGIRYCERSVDRYTKDSIIKKYDSLFGYQIGSMPRGAFKIDHLIPLCAGGGNSVENLWPQHKSVYEITDPIEPLLCQKMADGKLKQADAIKIVLQAKTHLDQVPALIQKLNSL